MKSLLILTLTACAMAQTAPRDCSLMLDSNPAKLTCQMNQVAPAEKAAPAPPKNGKEADAQVTQIYRQIGELQVELAKNPQYQQLKQLEDDLQQAKIRARVLHNQDDEAEALVRRKAEAAKK
jgi:hypothetical protein